MKAFVTGSTGFLGHGTVSALLESGHKARCMVRIKSQSKTPQGGGIEKFVVDYVNSGRLAQGVKDCDAVFNLTGIIREFPNKRVTFQSVHVDFTRNLLEACKAMGVKRYMHMSALGVDSGLDVGYNNSKLAAEKLVRESGLDWTIFRPSLIFGPGDRFAVEFAGWMKTRRPIPVIGKGDYRLMPVGRTDLCRGMVKLIDFKDSFGQIYNIGGAQTLNYMEILDIIEKAASANKMVIKMPAGSIMFIAGILGRFKSFPATKDMIKMLLKESVTAETKFWEHTGISPQKLEDGLPEYLV